MGMTAGSFQLQPGPQVGALPLAPAYKSQPWYSEYLAALFESDRRRLQERIRRAEHLMVGREHELFPAADPAEQRALNNALHALHALRTCLAL
ncbi:MAG TPA: hypothetical protein VGF06_05415 [Terriglobales bacterium]|jgi:hypothetical protein